MGKFDKKAGKKEPDAPKSQKVLKKRSSAELHGLNTDRSKERERNMKIFNLLERKEEIKASGGGSKINTKLNEDKIVKKAKRKEDSRKRKSS